MKKRLICLCLVLAMVTGLLIFTPAAAASEMTASDDCLNLIKAFEGFSETPYRDTDGHFTIGYGTRCPAELVDYYNENPMTTEQAEEELRKEIVTYEKAVNAFIDRHGVEFSQQQFDAIVSLVYNVGPNWLTKGTTLINALVSGATGNELIYAFVIYSLSGGNRSVGHIKRRLSEANVYLNGVYSRTLPDNFAYVIYDGRGGEVSSYNVQGYDTELTAEPVVVATRTGYTFKGWYADPASEEPVTVLDATTRNLTLFARWEPLEGFDPDDPGNGETNPRVVTVTGDEVNVRSGPGLGYGIVVKAQKGEQLTITEVLDNDGYTWGAFEKGWIALEYTDYFENAPAPCEHNYIVLSEKAPTCTEKGIAVYACTVCGDSYSKNLPATGHDYAGESCTEPGTCKMCGIAADTAPGHAYGEATCTVAATCTRCGKTTGAPLGHNYSAATCTVAKTCTRCNVTTGEPLGHSYGNDGLCTGCGQKDPEYKGPTVTVTGTNVNIREGAGLNYRVVGTVTAGDRMVITDTHFANGYLWGAFEKGWIALKYTDYDQIPAKPCNHNYEVTEKKEAACGVQGYIKYTCQNCADSYTDIIKMKAHSYGVDGRCVRCGIRNPDYKGPTVTVTGNGVNLRSGAGLSYKTIGRVNFGVKLVITQTQQKDGYLWGKSERGWIALKYTNYNQIITKPCSHNYGITSRKEATCTAQGSITYTCRDCNSSYVETVATRPHAFGAATCTAPGRCADCKLPIGSPLGHAYGEDGLCTRCDAKDPNYAAPEAGTKTYATIINTTRLNVRMTPNGTIVGTLKGGECVEILEQRTVKGGLWGRCSKGWIYIQAYARLENGQLGTVTASALNVRADAGTDYDVVGVLYEGDTVVILEKKTVNGTTWARIDRGWVSMTYIK